MEEADPKLQEADANEKRENFTFTSLANITSFVNSAKDTSVYVEYVNETNEEKTVNGCKHVIRRKNINSELYIAMKLEMVGTEPVIHFENDYGHAHMYHIHWDNERQEDYVQLLKTGIITVQVDKDIFLRLTLGKNSTPLSYNEVGDILYA